MKKGSFILDFKLLQEKYSFVLYNFFLNGPLFLSTQFGLNDVFNFDCVLHSIDSS